MPEPGSRQSRLVAGVRPPAALLARVAGARKVVEVGVGSAFDTALAFKAASPLTEVIVTDVSPSVTASAPAELAVFVDDVARPTWALYEDAALVYGVRLPEEMQVPAAVLARRVGALFAVRPLKDEWADVSEAFRRSREFGDGWRLYEA